MSNKYKILELLKENELTVREIADKTTFNENEVRVYIHRLLDDKLIKDIGKKNRWIIYTAIKQENSKLHNKLEKYHKLFEMIIDKHFSDLDPAIIEYIENNKEFEEEI